MNADTSRTLRLRRLPDGRTAVFAVRQRHRKLLHLAPDHAAGLAWTAAALGLRVTVAVPRHGRSRAKRLFNVRRLDEAAAHALRGRPARAVHVAVRALPGSAVRDDDAVVPVPAAAPEIVTRHIGDAVARHLADLSRGVAVPARRRARRPDPAAQARARRIDALADAHGVPRGDAQLLAGFLGPDEDDDALVAELEDLAARNSRAADARA